MLQVAVSVGSTASDIWRTVVVFEAPEDWTAAADNARRLGESKQQSSAPKSPKVAHTATLRDFEGEAGR